MVRRCPDRCENADREANAATDRAKEHGFEKKLQYDVVPARADRFTNADFSRSLDHRNEHDVHDPNSRHD